MIHVDHLGKTFRVKGPSRPGWFGLRATPVDVPAVRDISFDIRPGERVAFIGPNGAGKSTTLKMLSGLLRPTSGHAEVAGFVPWKDRRRLAYAIGLVFGQRSQLWHHVPVQQSFDLLGKIYGCSPEAYAAQLARLTEVFDLGPLLDKPVKTLSLGQRMRCEIAASLLHQPKILFLDEPTIGLDAVTKADVRDHLINLSAREGTTLVLTSHDTTDIEKICERVILVNGGVKLLDAPLEAMRQRYLQRRQVVLTTEDETPALEDLPSGVTVTRESHRLILDVDPALAPLPALIARALERLAVVDVTVNDVPLENVIRRIYQEG